MSEPSPTGANLDSVSTGGNDLELFSDRGEDSIHDNAVEDCTELLGAVLPVTVDGVKKA